MNGKAKQQDRCPHRIIVSPIGGTGFLFGRGNQQISPRVLSQVGSSNIIIVAARTKVEALNPRRLLVDTGDEILDQAFRGYTALQPATCEWWLVLGVTRDAPMAKIEEAFTKLAKQHHPDRGGDANQMSRLTEARRVAREERQVA